MAGIVAAGISLLGVLAAKIVIFVWVIGAVISGDTSNSELKQLFVARHIAEEILAEKGVKTEEASDAQWEEAGEKAERRVKSMKRAEVDRLAAEYREKDRLLAEEEEKKAKTAAASKPSRTAAQRGGEDAAEDDEDGGEDGDGADPGAGALVAFFFQASFGIIDALFIFLAVSSAFKLGAGGFSSS
ncbi:hypothetical protein RAS1_00970 [Phycisphaerae bacterium RAS1]|nr:hypothetical protein RAS1_00970 [Phycisphaerae bacterium RAS1]